MQSVSVLAFTTLASLCASAQRSDRATQVFAAGSLSGVIRDAEGIPQMGALVEAVLPNALLGVSAVTDSNGHYRITLPAGNYHIRATAALFLPAVRERLEIARGSRAVLNMTLAAMVAPTGWLPIARRASSEPGDEWMWTLRSSASRSILRFSGPNEDGSPARDVIAVSSSRQESRRGSTAGRVSLKESDGGFAQGGNHTVLVMTRISEDGSSAVLRADVSGPRSPYPVAASAEISAGFQRATPLNGVSRAVLTYSSHPELVSSQGRIGFQGATLRSGQRIELGDLIRVDAGSVLREANLGGNALIMEPFLRIASRPGSGVVVAYTMTRSRGTESLDDLDSVQAPVPLAVSRNGHSQFESGSHHALSVTGKIRGGALAEVSLYRDRFRNPMISGTGTLSPVDLHADDLVADPTTRTFRVVARDYSSSGVRLSLRQPVTKSLQVGASFSAGDALSVADEPPGSLGSLVRSAHSAENVTASAFVDGKILSTGSVVRAAYRWQRAGTLTAVDGFHYGDDNAYLSCSLRQSLTKVPFLPRGLEAVLDVRNLLAEGYQPFLSNDGQTLYLAQTPRTMQAGLSFSF